MSAKLREGRWQGQYALQLPRCAAHSVPAAAVPALSPRALLRAWACGKGHYTASMRGVRRKGNEGQQRIGAVWHQGAAS